VQIIVIDIHTHHTGCVATESDAEQQNLLAAGTASWVGSRDGSTGCGLHQRCRCTQLKRPDILYII
jgi:hypothetical protein